MANPVLCTIIGSSSSSYHFSFLEREVKDGYDSHQPFGLRFALVVSGKVFWEMESGEKGESKSGEQLPGGNAKWRVRSKTKILVVTEQDTSISCRIRGGAV